MLYGDFWEDWIHRFEDERNVLITPDNPAVVRYAKKLGLDRKRNIDNPVEYLWQSVYDDIDYKLTWEWSTPENTLFVGFGDCEDLSFLLSSLLPYLDKNKFKFVLGYLKGNGFGEQEHVWLEVDGNVVDATGEPGTPEKWTYDEVHSWDISIDRGKVANL